MPIEGLDSREKLVVVADVDENLCIVLHALRSNKHSNASTADRVLSGCID